MFKPYAYKKNFKKSSKLYSFSRNAYLKMKSVDFMIRFTSSAFSLTLGLYFMLGRVIIPMVQIYAASQDQIPIVNPLAADSQGPLLSAISQTVQTAPFTFTELGYSFRTDEDKKLVRDSNKEIPEKFYLTVPKIGIYDAAIETNSVTLDPQKALGHYKGSCLPDESCNVFIYGHSTNTWVKNRYEKGDYTSIFTRLDELKHGDEILLTYQNKTYRYVVDLISIKEPEDIDPLGQPYPKSVGVNLSTLELMTCTPAGTTNYRLSVVGKLVS